MRVGFLHIGLVLCAVVFVFSRCATVKTSVAPIEKAETLYKSGNFAEALPLYKQFITKADEAKQAVEAAVLKNAAVAAYQQKDYGHTLDWIERLGTIRPLEAEEASLFIESVAFVADDTRQLVFMNNHRELLIGSMGQEPYHSKLCQLHGRLGHSEGVVGSWNQADRATKLAWFTAYYDGVKTRENEEALIALCDQVLALDGDHIDALKNKAVLLFGKCETRYKQLMDGYNKNKNATSYAYLKRDLKLLSSDYRECRDLFEKLRRLEPGNRSHIQYLYNVYVRLDLNDQAKQLEKLL
ncbi:MAG: tetratricopeptide repeat protein [Breznakibacter sp.]